MIKKKQIRFCVFKTQFFQVLAQLSIPNLGLNDNQTKPKGQQSKRVRYLDQLMIWREDIDAKVHTHSSHHTNYEI